MGFDKLKESVLELDMEIQISSDKKRIIIENFDKNIVMTVSIDSQYINNDNELFKGLNAESQRKLIESVINYVESPEKNIDYGYTIEIDWSLGLDLSDSKVYIGMDRDSDGNKKPYFSDVEELLSIETLKYFKSQGIPLQVFSVYKVNETEKQKINDLEKIF